MISANPSLTEAQVRDFLQQTAMDMGAGGFDNTFGFGRVNAEAAVKRALGVAISGPDMICSTGNYSLNQTVPGTLVWSTSNSNGLAINSSGVATRVGNFNGSVTITVSVANGCGSITRDVWVGAPALVNYITINPSSYCTGTGESIYATIGGSPSYSQWSITSGNASNAYLADYGGGSAYFSTNVPDCYGLTLNMTNVCGSSVDGTTICKDYCFSAYQVFPNPAKDYITIQFDHYDKASVMPDQITLYSEKTLEPVYQLDNSQIFTATGKDGILKLDVMTLTRGTYYVHITLGKEGDKKTDKIRILLE